MKTMNLFHLSDLLWEAAGFVKCEEKFGVFQMCLISACVCGIEFCYAAETAFVSPTLLQVGVSSG